jgi:hypothetical protein
MPQIRFLYIFELVKQSETVTHGADHEPGSCLRAARLPDRQLPRLVRLLYSRFFQTPPRDDALAVSYDFTSISLSKGLALRAVEHARHTQKRPGLKPGHDGVALSSMTR